ncbi:MAG: sugar O-acetyltransferase [Muribaculaceae bacterium]|nr:sugar O-acetyltransferase [Muribaculaceae bacterium]
MTEKEKIIYGVLYDASDAELVDERMKAADLCHEYNSLRPSDTKRHSAIISELFGKVGDNCFIQPSFWCDYGYNIEVGDNFFANHDCVMLDCAKIKFGDNVLIGPQCGFHTAGHPLDVARRNKWLEYAYPITVGDNVWIGAGVQVMPGVTIGSNCVIGGGSVVTKDIPDGVIAAGNPCRVIREITDADCAKCRELEELDQLGLDSCGC